MIVDAYLHGPDARLRQEVRGRCAAIASDARLEQREAVGGSPRAARMKAIEKAAEQITVLMAV